MPNYGLMVSERFYYSFEEDCYYFSSFDRRMSKRNRVWKKCPFEDIELQHQFCFDYLSSYDYVKNILIVDFIHIEINEDGSFTTLRTWEMHDIQDYYKTSRCDVIEKEFKRILQLLKIKIIDAPIALVA